MLRGMCYTINVEVVMILRKSDLRWEMMQDWNQVRDGHFILYTKKGFACRVYLNTIAKTLVVKGKLPLVFISDDYLIAWQNRKDIDYQKRYKIREELRNRGYFVDVLRGQSGRYSIEKGYAI